MEPNFKEANAAAARGDWACAEDLYKKLIKKYPNIANVINYQISLLDGKKSVNREGG